MDNISSGRIRHRIQCLMGSFRSLDPESRTSRKIRKYQKELRDRGKRTVGTNHCHGSNADGRKAREDR